MQGYLAFVGSLGHGLMGLAMRVLLVLSGLMVAAPLGGGLGLSQGELSVTGMILALLPAAFAWRLGRPARPRKRPADGQTRPPAGGRPDINEGENR